MRKRIRNIKFLTPQIQIIQFAVLVFDKIFPVFVSESLDKLFGCLGTDLSFMVHKRSLSLSLLCTISYHCRQSKRIVLFSFSKMRKFHFTTFLKPDFLVKLVYRFFLLVSFVYNVLTPPDPQRSSLQEMFVFLSRVLAKHTQHALRAGRGGCNIVIGYQNILHACHASHGIHVFSLKHLPTHLSLLSLLKYYLL